MAQLASLAFLLLSMLGELTRGLVAPLPPAAITFHFLDRNEKERFDLLDAEGEVKPDVLHSLSHFVRCRRTDRQKQMHPRVVEIVAAVSRHFGDAAIDVISGYRAKPYGAPHSRHFLGRAMDIHVAGVGARKVAGWVWKNFRHVGVGYYVRQQFVHIDVRDGDVRWVDNSPKGEGGHPRYVARPSTLPLPTDAPEIAWDRAQRKGPRLLAMAGPIR